MLGLGKTLHVLHVRRAAQFPVQTIRPAVIRTPDCFAEVALLVFAKSTAAVTADVVEGVQILVPIADQDEAFAQHVLQDEVAWLRQLTLMPQAEPVTEKDALSFPGVNFR